MALLKRSLGRALRVVQVLMVVLVLIVAWSWMGWWLENRAMERFVAEGVHRAPTDTLDLGIMPTELVESSGLAVSRAYPGVLWSHNDSGDGPLIYQMDTTASLGQVFAVADAQAFDWESMDIGPCPHLEAVGDPPEWCIYAADVGDNERQRDTLTIYVVPEPDPQVESASVQSLAIIRYGYSGASYDVEALAVTPEGDLVIVTKGRTPDILLFHVPAEDIAAAVRAGEVMQLSGGVRLPIEPEWGVGRVTTGASVSPDGTLLAVRTYTEIYFFRWPVGPTPEQVAPPCFMGEYEPQGEAVAFWTDGRLLLSSETWTDRPGHLLALSCAGVNAAWPQSTPPASLRSR